MHLSIHHETVYRYAQPQVYSISLLRLTPPALPFQTVRQWKVNAPGTLRTFTDAFGNHAHQMSVTGAHKEIVVVASGEVITHTKQPLVLPMQPTDAYVFAAPSALTHSGRDLQAFVQATLPQGLYTVQDALTLAQAICAQVRYLSGSTDVAFSAQEAFALGRGVCQDHAHIFLACVRALGRPARYVSGYVNVDDTGHIATHAWADVAVDGQWWPIDITHRCLQDTRHVRLAVGTDYNNASPMRGVRVGQGSEKMVARVLVEQQ
jgi:transglutaminase-like putative cysteine protease